MAELTATIRGARIIQHPEIGRPTPNVAERGDVLVELADGSTAAMTKARFLELFPDAELSADKTEYVTWPTYEIDPADEDTDVALDKTVTLTFDAIMDDGIDHPDLFIAPVPEEGEPSADDAVAAVVTVADNVITINPDQNLAAETEYAVVVTAAVKSAAGNPIKPAPQVTTFTTASSG